MHRGAEGLEVQHLTDEAASLAALNFGGVDKKIAERIKGLSEGDYNALILQARLLDEESGIGVHEVEKAVEALHKFNLNIQE